MELEGSVERIADSTGVIDGFSAGLVGGNDHGFAPDTGMGVGMQARCQ